MKNQNDETETEQTWEVVTTPTALESLERANIDMQIATAKRYPRSLAIVKKRMLDLATLDTETAASCFYRLNRQGKMIEGPTIRLAEIAGSSFGNLRYGARVINNDGKIITAQGYCFDLEANVMSQVEVQRRITDRNGNTYSEDMQVVTGNAACAIAARNAVFKVVPFAFIKPIFSAAKKAAVGDIKTLIERRTAMLAKFAAFGVTQKRILATLGKQGVDEIGLDELETLIGLHNAIEDKEQTVDEAFPVPIEKPKISKPTETSQSGTATQSQDPAPGLESIKPVKKKLKRVQKEEPKHPLADQVQERLNQVGRTVYQFYMVAVKNKWVDEISGAIPPPDLFHVSDFADEEKCAVFLDADSWSEILGALEE